jgi:hypothetical protein
MCPWRAYDAAKDLGGLVQDLFRGAKHAEELTDGRRADARGGC